MWNFDPEDSNNDLPTRHEKPFFVKKYKPNHLIVNEDWVKKSKEDMQAAIKDDSELNPYWDKEPALSLMYEKQTENRFDPEEFNMFKVTMDVRDDFVESKSRQTRNTNFIR